jgi:hypothetical protein
LTIVGSTKDPQIAKLFREEAMGRLPLPEDVRDLELRFDQAGFD